MRSVHANDITGQSGFGGISHPYLFNQTAKWISISVRSYKELRLSRRPMQVSHSTPSYGQLSIMHEDSTKKRHERVESGVEGAIVSIVSTSQRKDAETHCWMWCKI